jgi:hypothetical protein
MSPADFVELVILGVIVTVGFFWAASAVIDANARDGEA